MREVAHHSLAGTHNRCLTLHPLHRAPPQLGYLPSPAAPDSSRSHLFLVNDPAQVWTHGDGFVLCTETFHPGDAEASAAGWFCETRVHRALSRAQDSHCSGSRGGHWCGGGDRKYALWVQVSDVVSPEPRGQGDSHRWASAQVCLGGHLPQYTPLPHLSLEAKPPDERLLDARQTSTEKPCLP